MDREKFENAVNDFFMCVSSLEYSLKGYCTFETVSLSKREEQNALEVQRSIVKPTLSNPIKSHQNDPRNIGINLSKFLSEKEEVSITPNMLKKEFLYCKKCSRSNVKRVLAEGDIASSIAFVLTDTVPLENERAYLDKVLSSIHLEVGKNAYLTSLLKCEGESKDFDADAASCKELLEKQLSLTSASGFIAFGKRASEYLKEVKKRDAFSLSAFIYSSSLSELQSDKAQKEKLWNSFKKLAVFLNLPRI